MLLSKITIGSTGLSTTWSEGEQLLGSEHTVQCTDDVLQNCTPETYRMLLTNNIPLYLVEKEVFVLGTGWVWIVPFEDSCSPGICNYDIWKQGLCRCT